MSRRNLRTKINNNRKPAETTTTKKRHCLKCGETFLSQHAGHRICEPCNEQNTKEPLPQIYKYRKSLGQKGIGE